ncbi:hypothetical protein OZN62_06280 [Aurantiacibacter sp. MUD11]|uniref:hypothetical protein n=1 Tax=Aurantiacibacter sp. MUD11 TaxID=3003265 RepID=UPI0022AAA2C3|nr:hypothetical protein [Aurantiacibacter sp. MUD11]WAT19168.1 hypothetical protein OZN62_06280 [Aurantiacibacter sp. MUD11]
MTETNPFASLGPMLLARKGTAKPAMRAQLTPDDRVAELGDDFDNLAASQSDLGWDDMGDDQVETHGNDNHVVQLPVTRTKTATKSPVQRKAASTPARRKAAERGRRAAFTLRLDSERHMKLRLASTMQECSAQELVTAALDKFLEDIPELDSIAAHLAGKKSQA